MPRTVYAGNSGNNLIRTESPCYGCISTTMDIILVYTYKWTIYNFFNVPFPVY